MGNSYDHTIATSTVFFTWCISCVSASPCGFTHAKKMTNIKAYLICCTPVQAMSQMHCCLCQPPWLKTKWKIYVFIYGWHVCAHTPHAHRFWVSSIVGKHWIIAVGMQSMHASVLAQPIQPTHNHANTSTLNMWTKRVISQLDNHCVSFLPSNASWQNWCADKYCLMFSIVIFYKSDSNHDKPDMSAHKGV